MAEFSIIQDIVDAAGIKAATAIVEEKGGQEHVYFPLPDSLRCNHWLVLLIGMEKAKSVCSVIGGGRVLIPKQIRHQKEEHIFQLIRDGESTSTISERCGIHMRTVRRYKKRLREQGELIPA